MNHPIWSNPPLPPTMPSPLAEGLASLHASKEVAEFRGEQYPYTHLFYVCDETGEHFVTEDAANHNVEQVYGPYRQRYGIPAPHELTMFRKSVDLSAAVMSKLLGFGANQWTRYEQGEVPNRANGLLLRLAVRNAAAWQSLLEAGKTFFHTQPRLYARLRAKTAPDAPTPGA